MTDKDFIRILEDYGQQSFAEMYRSLPEQDRNSILKQSELIDFGMLGGAKKSNSEKSRGVISPMKTLTMAEYGNQKEHFREIGLEAIRAGKTAALVLAGGMGTRLGFEHAKGMYNIGITKPLYIFEQQIKNLTEVVEEAGVFIHTFVMVNYLNEREVKEFFKEHDYFGYDRNYVHFFSQDMSPCLDAQGEMFLSGCGEIAMSPNGNGGFYSSLVNAGLKQFIDSNGIEYINVFAVDNVLQKIVDPVFVGAVIESGMATGAKVVKKVSADERVGAICLEDGTPSVVEYYEMTKELLEEKLPDGSPAYDYGVILNYLFRVSDIDKVVNTSLPVHPVKKKVPYLSGTVTVMPEAPNAFKLETLSLDLVHLTSSCLSFEVEREKEFAPIKNFDGIDSVESARELLKKNGINL